MTSPQAVNILQYISAKFGVDYECLSSKILTAESQTIEVNDSVVYSLLQELIPSVPAEDDLYHDK